MKKFLVILLLLNNQYTAQVMSKDSLWIDDFFDTFDLIVIPQYEFIFANLSLEHMKGKKVSLPDDYWGTRRSEHPLSEKIGFNVLHGGGISLGLRSKNIDFFVSYYTGLNQFRDNSYDTPYNSSNNIKIGDTQILIERLGANSHYWFTKNYGVGLEYELLNSIIEIIRITDRTGGISSIPIARFSIFNNFLYLYTPIKFSFDRFNVNLLAGFTLYSSGQGSTSINDIDDINFSKDSDTPFGVKLNLGVNTKLFNYLPFGIMYKFNYLTSKNEYSYMTNTISLQIGIPKL